MKTHALISLVAVLHAALVLAQEADHDHDHEDEHVEREESSATVRTGKIVLICVLGALTFACSLLPWVLTRYTKRAALVMGLCSCFSAGVILGAGLCHMLPESQETFHEYFLAQGTDIHFSFAGVSAGGVLLLLIAIDRLFVDAWMEKNAPQAANAHAHAHGNPHVHSHPSGHGHSDKPSPLCETVAPCSVDSTHVECGGNLNPHTISLDAQSEDLEDITVNRGSVKQVARAWVFFLALSLHSVFDGMSVGAESEAAGFWAMTLAVLSHKALDGFALGTAVFYANLPVFHAGAALVFCALMTPLGIGIGWAATATVSGASGQLATAVIVSMSAGSFLFISIVELLPTGLAGKRKYSIWKLLLCALGFGIMAVLGLWV